MRRLAPRTIACFAPLAAIRAVATKLYTASHEWVSVEDGVATVGITDHAQEALGSVVYVSLPVAGDKLEAKDVFGAVESVKASSDVYCPVSGVVSEVNAQLQDKVNLVNESAEKDGWMIKLKDVKVPDGLMDSAKYEEFLKQNAH